MGKMRWGLIHKIVLFVTIAGVILTLIFVTIERYMVVQLLHGQMDDSYNEMIQYAADCVDWVVAQEKYLCVQCSYLPRLSGGNREEISDDLKNFLSQNNEWIRRTYYIGPDGEMYSSHQAVLESLQKTLNYSIPRDLVRSAPKNGAVSMSDVYRSSMITSNTIAFFKRITGTTNASSAGYVMLEMDLSVLERYMSEAFQRSKVSYILQSGKGNIILKNVQPDIPDEVLHNAQGAAEGWTSHTDSNRVRYRFCRSSQTSESNWSIILILNEEELYLTLNSLTRTTVLVSSLLFAALTLALIMIVSHFVRPVRALADQMNHIQKIENGLEGYTPFLQNDEIGELSKCFGQMLERIAAMTAAQKEIAQKRIEAEIRSLQYQLRPHFLYNSLNAVSALAMTDQAEKIPPMIEALIHMLAMNTDKVGEFIPLGQEIEYIEKFTSIMKLRYGDRFDLSVSLEESFKKYLVPKMILQPLVENSVYHGCMRVDRRGLIVIAGAQSKEGIRISVIDNGCGIDQEKLEHLLEMDTPNDTLRSTGLPNTHSRIHLYFGETYGLTVSSKVGVGTKVEILLPRVENLQEMERIVQ